LCYRCACLCLLSTGVVTLNLWVRHCALFKPTQQLPHKSTDALTWLFKTLHISFFQYSFGGSYMYELCRLHVNYNNTLTIAPSQEHCLCYRRCFFLESRGEGSAHNHCCGSLLWPVRNSVILYCFDTVDWATSFQMCPAHNRLHLSNNPRCL